MDSGWNLIYVALGPRLRQYEEYFQKSKDIQGNC